MKKIYLAALLLSGLAACSPPTPYTVEQDVPKADPTQTAVTAYLKKSLDDPASYQPARWGKEVVWQKKDADKAAADTMQPSLTHAKAEGDRLAEKWASAKAKGHSTTASWHQMMQEADTVYMRLYKKKVVLERSSDTTRLGTVISHAYRAKNKMGALQLDSARFLVSKNGQVTKL